jgi:hypothetical protein
MSNSIKIRITARNNSDCRAFDVLDETSATVKHNGGKTMIAMVSADELETVKGLLDESRMVSGYEVQS